MLVGYTFYGKNKNYFELSWVELSVFDTECVLFEKFDKIDKILLRSTDVVLNQLSWKILVQYQNG